MDAGHWPFPLRHRLGDDASRALADVLDAREQNVLNVATERFERRLSEECSKLRSEMLEFRSETRHGMALLRSEVLAEIANTRAELIKWAFLFWAGQLATNVALISLFR